MNLRDLRYLVALADSQHFGRAALRCHVSQPTLSAQLKKLEQQLGAPLIERQPRRITLTPLGQQVVVRARRLLAEADDIQSLAYAHRDPLAGRLNLALIPTVGPYLLPGIAPRLRRRLPKLKLQLFEYQTAPLLEKLAAGEIDLGILALPLENEAFETRRLYEEPFVLALPEKHRLASQATIRRGDLEGETLLLLADGHCLRDQALEVCEKLQLHEDQDYRATSLETLRQMVASGAGITLLPELSTTGPFSHTRGLVIRPFSRPVPGRTVGAVWRRSTTREPAIRAVADVVAEAMQ